MALVGIVLALLIRPDPRTIAFELQAADADGGLEDTAPAAPLREILRRPGVPSAVIAALASELPRRQQRPAIRVGLALAYLFRVLALLVASWLTANTWVRWFGSTYLIWLMSSHLTKGHAHDVAGKIDASYSRSNGPGAD